MKQQVLVIHGGHVSASHEDFLMYLKEKEFDPAYLKPRSGWKQNLQKDLGDKFEVFTPPMPNKENAQYEEWKIWFEKIIVHVSGQVIVVGHSLGGIFLLKYLSEHRMPINIIALLLVAAPHNDQYNPRGAHSGFFLQEDLTYVSSQVSTITFFHSKDDAVVPVACFEHFKQDFPRAHFELFENRGHFNQESFPEILDAIRASCAH